MRRRPDPVPRIHDISQPLHPRVPVWPGEPPFAYTRLAAIGPDCPINVGSIAAGVHTGTHADAPLHYDPAGADSASCSLDPYIGPCVLADVRHAGATVGEADVPWQVLAGAERVLLRTYESFPSERWDSAFKAIDAAVIARMAAMGVVLIGTDAASLDPEQSKTLDAHHAVQSAGMRILEGLVLDAVPPGRYELIALPLRIVGADASPVRAILRELSE
ncbi:arylformamidase [Sphingomonas canadensis]|uniref:Kynurenine formamidase n=1 Tax=Sphingomonas canadensis TaxID=1219257 RepID=A0ABW3H7E3_9SPHN|nr:arylformamidase [Sphingomonas canadensis]MCW3836932.1 arylformamidase [Sphingomonas canadensis]